VGIAFLFFDPYFIKAGSRDVKDLHVILGSNLGLLASIEVASRQVRIVDPLVSLALEVPFCTNS